MSEVFQAIWQFLRVQPLRNSVYQPQTKGLVEHFNGTLKRMLRKFVGENGRDWPQWIPNLLSTEREVPQATTGFSPFELLYGRQPGGLLIMLREEWETPITMADVPSSFLDALRQKTRTTSQLES